MKKFWVHSGGRSVGKDSLQEDKSLEVKVNVVGVVGGVELRTNIG